MYVDMQLPVLPQGNCMFVLLMVRVFMFVYTFQCGCILGKHTNEKGRFGLMMKLKMWVGL